ncbi:MAG: tetratricopeptide repeat protein [Planctomycetota bacterium]
MKYVVVLTGFIFLVAACLLPAENKDDMANIFYQSGVELQKQNKYSEAVIKFTKVLSYKKDFPDVLFRLGECYEKLQDKQKAARNYRLCQKCLKKQAGRSRESEELLLLAGQRLDKIDPTSSQFSKLKIAYTSKLINLTKECQGRKYPRLACWMLENLLAVDSCNKAAGDLFDNLNREIGGYKRKLLSPQERRAELMLDQGYKHFKQGKTDLAIEEYTQAIELDPQNAEAYYRRGNVYLQQRDTTPALADFDEAIKIDPKKATAYAGRGRAYLYLNDHPKCIANLCEAIKIDPTYDVAYLYRGYFFIVRGDLGNPITEFTQAVKLNPKNIEAYTQRGKRYVTQRKFDKALADFNDAIKIDPGYAPAYYERALAYSADINFKEAIKDAEKYLELEPDGNNARQITDLLDKWREQK